MNSKQEYQKNYHKAEQIKKTAKTLDAYYK